MSEDAPPTSSGWKSQFGNLAAGSLLAGLSVILLGWQTDNFLIEEPGARRIFWAVAVTVIYVAGCALLFLIRRAREPVGNTAHSIGGVESGVEHVLVAYASQTGHAETLAGQTAESLRSAGIRVDVRSFRHLDAQDLQAIRRALFIVSTTGEGDAPDMAAGFIAGATGAAVQLQDLNYALLALGDSDYTNFCGFGHDLEALLRKAGARAMFDTIEVDNGDAGALRLWQYHLGQLSGRSDLPDWQVPEYSRWRLVERRLINPGSVGDPCFHIALEPVDAELPFWQAGDIVEIGPQQAPADVESWLQSNGLDGGWSVTSNGRRETLRTVAARSALASEPGGHDPQQTADSLLRLPHRDYSIASIPEDGCIELLLRQWRRSDGSLGLGTGWMTEHARVGDDISVRIRANNGFHVPKEGRPLLLIGNGTGIASLRAHIKQRALQKHHRNWLIFGERNADRDFHFRDEILAWQKQGIIERLDLAFSRDQAERIYVQQRLLDAADHLRTWIGNGAEILVCGSLEGMAPAVDDALRRVLGNSLLDELIASGRYRRDLY